MPASIIESPRISRPNTWPLGRSAGSRVIESSESSNAWASGPAGTRPSTGIRRPTAWSRRMNWRARRRSVWAGWPDRNPFRLRPSTCVWALPTDTPRCAAISLNVGGTPFFSTWDSMNRRARCCLGVSVSMGVLYLRVYVCQLFFQIFIEQLRACLEADRAAGGDARAGAAGELDVAGGVGADDEAAESAHHDFAVLFQAFADSVENGVDGVFGFAFRQAQRFQVADQSLTAVFGHGGPSRRVRGRRAARGGIRRRAGRFFDCR